LPLGLAAQLQASESDAMTEAIHDAVAQLEQEIRSLRALVTDLRPAALDDLGAQAAIEDLAERARGRGLDVDLVIDLAYEQGREPRRHGTEFETAMYRIVQEALNNATKHGAARRAHVEVIEDDSTIRVTVRDDGRGFDPIARTDGFGLIGMRERVELLHGKLEVTSSPEGGTTISATFPTRAPGAPDRASPERDRLGADSVIPPRA
jgi:signal transduction histidine kinase